MYYLSNPAKKQTDRETNTPQNNISCIMQLSEINAWRNTSTLYSVQVLYVCVAVWNDRRQWYFKYCICVSTTSNTHTHSPIAPIWSVHTGKYTFFSASMVYCILCLYTEAWNWFQWKNVTSIFFFFFLLLYLEVSHWHLIFRFYIYPTYVYVV